MGVGAGRTSLGLLRVANTKFKEWWQLGIIALWERWLDSPPPAKILEITLPEVQTLLKEVGVDREEVGKDMVTICWSINREAAQDQGPDLLETDSLVVWRT